MLSRDLLIGIPIGVERLAMTSLDDKGILRRGELPYRTLRRGKLWDT